MGGGVLVRWGVRLSSDEWRGRSGASDGVSGVGSE